MTEPQIREEKIRSMYALTNGNLGDAIRILRLEHGIKTSKSYIEKEWGNAGYIKYQQKINITEEDRTLIIRRYKMYKGDPILAAQSMRFPYNIIKTVWKESGLEIRINGRDEELAV